MLKFRKTTASVVAMLLIVVISCSAAFAGTTNNIELKENNNVEVTEQNTSELKKVTKENVTRGGRCQAIMDMQNYINDLVPFYGELRPITVDGIYGPKTREAFIRLWQKEVNLILGYNAIVVDGIFGAKSREISQKFMLKLDNQNSERHVVIVSAILIWFGYEHTFTHTFTPEFGNAVREFQRDHGLAADGIVGPDTYYALFNK